ncbi:MAG: T9SS type A sorting domain-containing protein [Sphingobacteriales bacterium]|nr:T9SS type A sorting domain-containing protein [Sphingobacteriales bacterium]
MIFADVGIVRCPQRRLFAVFPNPASDFITLNSSEIIESVEIYDAAGRLRLAQKGIGHQIDVRNFASGSYFVKAQIQGRNYIHHFTKH